MVVADDLLVYKSAIDSSVDEYLKNENSLLNAYHKDIADMVWVVDDFATRGGKRLRAIFVIAGYLLNKKSITKDVIKVASIMEHFQNWMLIHDDIIDNSIQRRKGDTLHVALKKKYSDISEKIPQFPVNLSIVLGDVIESYILDILTNTKFMDKKKLMILSEYNRMLRYTGYGQLLDVLLSAEGIEEATEEKILKMMEYKTAYYTVAIPLKMGGILSELSEPKLKALENFGINLGIAFQILDDLFGAGYNVNESTDKIGNDIPEGKKTVPVLKAYNLASDEEKKFLSDSYRLPARDDECSKKIKSIMDEYNTAEETEKLYNEYRNKAVAYLDIFNKNEKEILNEVVSIVLNRNY